LPGPKPPCFYNNKKSSNQTINLGIVNGYAYQLESPASELPESLPLSLEAPSSESPAVSLVFSTGAAGSAGGTTGSGLLGGIGAGDGGTWLTVTGGVATSSTGAEGVGVSIPMVF
jgi:hypothetical protein